MITIPAVLQVKINGTPIKESDHQWLIDTLRDALKRIEPIKFQSLIRDISVTIQIP